MDEGEGIPDVEDIEPEEEEIIHETMFTFQAFEMVSDSVFIYSLVSPLILE